MIEKVFEARNAPIRLAMFAFGSLVFVAAGLWFIGVFGPDHPQGRLVPIVGWITIVLFGTFASIFVRRMFDKDPVMRIDERGIWWKSWSSETIPWNAVVGIHHLTIQRQKMLGIELSDPALYPSETWLGRLGGANFGITGVHAIWLNTSGTDRTFQELVAAVGDHFPLQ